MEKRLKAIAILALVSIFFTTLFGYGSAKGAESTFLYPNLEAAIRGTIGKFEVRGGGVLQYANEAPAQPTNTSPVDRATDVSLTPLLESSAFFDPDVGDTHAASQWQITTVGTHNIRWTVFDSEEDTCNLTSITIPVGTLYYYTGYDWRVRHKDSYGNWSDWSAETHFSTIANQVPSQPINISPPDGATDVSLTLVLQSSVFSDHEGDAHAASQWQITTKPGNYSSPVFDSGRDADNVTSIAVPIGTLTHSTTYYWRVRHRQIYDHPIWGPCPGGLCWSDWSTETSFTTEGEPWRASSWVWVIIGIGAVTSLAAGTIFRRYLIRK